MDVSRVPSDGLYRLFEACANVHVVCFTIEDVVDVDNALDCIEKLVQVPRNKETLRSMGIIFEEFHGEDSDDDAKKQFETGIPTVLPKMRLRRCEVRIIYSTYST